MRKKTDSTMEARSRESQKTTKERMNDLGERVEELSFYSSILGVTSRERRGKALRRKTAVV